MSRSVLILKVLTNAVYQSLHTIDGVPDVLASDLSVSCNGIALDEIERRNPLADRAVRLKIRIVGHCVVE